jgi:hypothetical protein
VISDDICCVNVMSPRIKFQSQNKKRGSDLRALVTLFVIAFWMTAVSDASLLSSSPVRVASKKDMSCLRTASKVCRRSLPRLRVWGKSLGVRA